MDILPHGVYFEEPLKGRLLMAFLVSVVFSSIKYDLIYSDLSTFNAIINMHKLRITKYDSIRVLEDLSIIQKEVFSRLKLDCLLPLEKCVLTKKNLYSMN